MNNEKVEEKFDYPLEKMYVRHVEEIVSEFKNFSTLISKKEL